MIFLQCFVWVTQTTAFTMYDYASPQKMKRVNRTQCNQATLILEKGQPVYHGFKDRISESVRVYFVTDEKQVAKDCYAKGPRGQVLREVLSDNKCLVNLNNPQILSELLPTKQSREMARVFFHNGTVPDPAMDTDYSFLVEKGQDGKTRIRRVSVTMKADLQFVQYLLNDTVWERLCKIAGVRHLDGTFWSGDGLHDEIWFREGVLMEPEPELESEQKSAFTREDVICAKRLSFETGLV